MKTYRFYFLFFMLMFVQIRTVPAQDILRIELDASALNLPYYTIPAGENGLIVLRGMEIRGRRIIGWEMIHYSTAFRELSRKTFFPERTGSFAGWEKSDSHVYLLFLYENAGVAGEVVIYDPVSLESAKKTFSFPKQQIREPVFKAIGEHFFICGINTMPPDESRTTRRKFRQGKLPSELLFVSGSLNTETVTLTVHNIPDLIEMAWVQPDPDGLALLLALRISGEKFTMDLRTVRFTPASPELVTLFTLPSPPEMYLIDLSFLRTGRSGIAVAGTYGTRDRQSWKRGDPVLSEGLFFAQHASGTEMAIRFYPFTSFKNLPSSIMQAYLKRSRTTGRNQPGKGQIAYRMLLHEQAYSLNGNMVLVGEAFYPEYEYENRPQSAFYYPYGYSPWYGGYYPGFYDTGGRWVFKGFRYEHAIVAAFDSLGNLTWENSFETSNILDKNLNERLSLLAYENEIVLVYAHDGKVWFRIIRDNDVVVDKESYPVEMLSPADRVREHLSMNMTRWYNQYFLVWGRQVIRGADGRSRTVYYCNKLAFE
ncbi:MAG: hypothetical protein R6V49_11555 [Bacteroidales bacterium]